MNYISFKIKERQICKMLRCSAHGKLSLEDVSMLTGIHPYDCKECCYRSKKLEFVHSSHVHLSGVPLINLLTN